MRGAETTGHPTQAASLVRPSRAGDQFHYLWAARRCLPLLSPAQDLVGVSIEGVSPAENSRHSAGPAGDAVIDIAEYYGNTDPKRARRISYVQLKHSSRRISKPWSQSGLARTLRGFSVIYKDWLQEFGAEDVAKRFEFRFVTNRPISAKTARAVQDTAQRTAPRDEGELAKLKRSTDLADAELSAFCSLLCFESEQDDVWNQRNILFQEVRDYLPGPDVDAPTQLTELVTRKALPESEQNPLIEKPDVLRALKTDESSLYPAPCLITYLDSVIVREQEADLVQEIVQAEGRPVVVHALAGVGKSVFATRIQAGLPAGSVSILYDCYGHGQYRNVSGFRHRHQDALVQIANELAAMALCHPLVPAVHAEATAYVRAFLFRLRQAITVIRGTSPRAVLCIVVDAADNAQQAAEENGQSRSFARDLLREAQPEGVRLVVLCRSHRQNLLNPPPSALRLELGTFTRTETAAHLRQSFPGASGHDVEEFHRLSSRNPRVQALALSQSAERNRSLPETLRSLGPHPTTVDDAIKRLLEDAVSALQDSASEVEARQIQRVCVGLALLRPRVPISVLAEVSGVSQAAVQSFVLDIGRPLLLADSAVQFLDEPVETWLRDRFKPQPDEMREFIHGLIPLAAGSAYVAATLPQLMLEAGQLPELVELALNSAALPETSTIEKRDVEVRRAQFALKAGLRSRRYVDAAKLALKAGEQTAGDSRRRRLIQANTDIAALFLAPDRVQEIVSRRIFGSGWRGSHHVYEAGLLSGRREFAADARSRLRMADEWLRSWNGLAADEREEERVSDADIAELVTAQLNVHGPGAAVRAIGAWRPRRISLTAGRMVAERLIDHGRIDDAKALADAAGKNLRLVLAVIAELREVQETPSAEVVQRTLRHAVRGKTKARSPGVEDREGMLVAIVGLVEAALKRSVCSCSEAAGLLTRCLPSTPPRGLTFRHSCAPVGLLRAYSLRAALTGETLELIDLAHPELKVEIEKKESHSLSREAEEFKRDVGALLTWCRLWAAASVGKVTKRELPDRLAEARDASKSAMGSYHGDNRHVAGEVALIWFDILNQMDAIDAESINRLASWLGDLSKPLFTPALNQMARLGVRRRETRAFALGLAAQAFGLIRDERMDAGAKLESYIDTARAVLAGSTADAKAYFDEAVAVASRVGDENLPRWEAMLDLAERAGRREAPVPAVAYQVARCAELTHHYAVDDKYFDWTATVRVLSLLCPRSSLAILSRWRDRRFGWTGEILPAVVDALIERGYVDPRDALPLIGFEGQWEHAKLLDAALKKCENAQEKQAAKELLFRYAKYCPLSASTWTRLREVIEAHGLSASDLDAYVAFAELKERTASQTRSVDVEPRDDSRKRNWDEVFAEHDLTTANGIAEAYAAFRRTPPPFERERFFAEAIRRVSAGAEADFVIAASDAPVFSRYCYSDLFGQIPEEWCHRPAVRMSLERAVKTVCRRFCMEVSKHRHWEFAPFDDAFKRTGVTEEDIIDVVLDGVSESVEIADSDRLFSLVGLLTSKLNGDGALEALTFGLGLFEPALESTDGDGPWSNVLAPPATVEESVAGYVYAGLAAPAAAVRWEAAHAVLGLCALGRADVLRHLLAFAESGTGVPFVDAGLPFYRLHAFQWLMAACARAATDYAASLGSFAQRFVDWALNDQPQVLIRQFAARTALALLRHGFLPTGDWGGHLDRRLRHVNVTKLPVVESRSFQRVSPDTTERQARDDKDRFYFYMDIGPYWYEPLGRVFGLPQSRVETEALEVIRGELHHSADGRTWRDDERRCRSLYSRDRYGMGRTHASHGSYPDTDDYDFYLAYHAMMIVAGRFLETVPTHRDGESGETDEFAEWLSRHDVTRNDGRWLADRRDPVPCERPVWQERKEDDPEYDVITSIDLEEALGTKDVLTVWGYWTTTNSGRVQSVWVRSALVSRGKSMALLRALSTVDNVYVYSIPSADAEHEIDRAGFVLKGWIACHGGDGGIDGKDKWSGGVSHPPPVPAAEVVELMALQTDADKRIWQRKEGRQVLWSRVWGELERRGEDNRPEGGERLRGSIDFVVDLLATYEHDLIVEVQMERSHQRWRYESRRGDDEQPARRTRLYLVTADGRVASL